jgi:dienelactone hydrolase
MTNRPVRGSRRYWLRLLSLVVILTVLPIILLPTGIGALSMWMLTHPGCGDGANNPSVTFRHIEIPSRFGKPYRGFFIPGTNGATVVVPPPYNSGRGGMLPEASLIAADGFNVLVFESRLCSGRSATSLGYAEVEDVGAVLDYLKNNAADLGVDTDKIALHGFSSAGATSTMAAARYSEIAAVLAEGGYHDMERFLVNPQSTNTLEAMMVFGSRLTYRLTTGYDVSVLSPLDAITHISPRPIFLVYGTKEPSLSGARQQFAAVKAAHPDAPIQLWEVPNATHGGYLNAVGVDEYKRHVLPFYHCALLSDCDAWNALWTQ